METVKKFLLELMSEIDIDYINKKEDIILSRVFLDKLNKFLYQSNNEYISPFHEYWEKNHEEIINIKIDRKQAKKIAEVFEKIFSNPESFPELQIKTSITYPEQLTKQNIANIRFFTAIQDFKINIYKNGRNPFEKYLEKPEWFEPTEIIEKPEYILEFLDYLDATGSQGDKRKKWMLAAANFLLEECDGQAYNLIKLAEGDVEKIRNFIADKSEIGYSRKKADMFIRDMLDWEVWDTNIGVEKLNVASDSNTMRVALRTGLINPEFPLLASYLDIYGLQYVYVDKKTQEGWRIVWEEWKKLPNNHCPKSPASMDYLIYRSIGKKFCWLNKRKCEKCILNEVCPLEKRNLKPPKAISIHGMTGWISGKTDNGGGGGIMA